MAIDQNSPLATTDPALQPAIDNEFPTYRAISSLAVFSLVLGLAAVFCFANLWFLLLTAGSTLTGWLAIRKIRRFPEVLTGATFARVGIGVGLLFGLSALTHEVTTEIMTTIDASRFAKHYVKVLKDEPVSMAVWYEQPVEFRKTKAADEVVQEIKKQKSASNPDPYGKMSGGFVQIKERLKVPGQDIHFSAIESKAFQGLTTYANALVEIDGPPTSEYPKKQYALVQMVKPTGAGPFEWIVQDFKYPYTPASITAEIKAADDGHGHAGSH